MPSSVLQIQNLKQTEIKQTPFPHVIISDVINKDAIAAISQDFPKINKTGSFPLNQVKYGPAFARLIADLESSDFRTVVGEKFNKPLDNNPVFTTIRGQVGPKDGRIHTDTKTKLMTVLLYLNEDWSDDKGRLRLLNNSDDITDYVAEITPKIGTLLIFEVTENCWHGHLPYQGERRSLQMNYLTNERALRQHQIRHNRSARIKKLKSWIGL